MDACGLTAHRQADVLKGSKIAARMAAAALAIWIYAGKDAANAADAHIAACAKAQAEVAGGSSAARDLVCEAADRAVRLLGRCEIAPRGPLRVEIAPSVKSPFGTDIFGRFDAGSDVTFVTNYEKAGTLAGGTPYAAIPHADFYRSLVVHELVHAILVPHQTRLPSSRAAVEYPAYALQVASMPEKVREDFLAAAAGQPAPTAAPLLFNDILLAFDPFYFAARAYDHFAASADGCKNIIELLKGDVSFVATII